MCISIAWNVLPRCSESNSRRHVDWRRQSFALFRFVAEFSLVSREGSVERGEKREGRGGDGNVIAALLQPACLKTWKQAKAENRLRRITMEKLYGSDV